MRLSWSRVGIVARREFLTTIRRKAFLFTVFGTPAYFMFVLWVSTAAETRERHEVLRELSTIGVVDSSGLYAGATREIRTELTPDDNPMGRARGPRPRAPVSSFKTDVHFFPDQAAADSALRAQGVSQVIVIPSDYLEHGRVRRYARSSSLFSGADGRVIGGWLANNLVRGRVDSVLAARVSRPTEDERLYNLSKSGGFELKDDRRQVIDMMLPIAFAMLLGLSITMGGQYLLQGIAEEKETRILESLLCAVSPEELMAGKLVGLGGAGLLLVGLWVGVGALASGPAFAMLDIHLPPGLIALTVVYFLCGYLFYGSLMTGIGAMANTMREAQQFSVWFMFANFVPLIMFATVVGRPGSPLAVALSLFPPTAPTAMLMRLTAPSFSVPAWQIGLSILLLGATTWAVLVGSARVFRIGLLLYGKTPNLPEILRWARQRA